MMEMMMHFSRNQQVFPNQHLTHGGAQNIACNTEIPASFNPNEVFTYHTQGLSGGSSANKEYSSDAQYFTSQGKSYGNLR
jgi:hypothetical protein